MKLNLYMLAFLAFGCSDKENATTNNTKNKSEETTTETNSETVKSEQKEVTETNSETVKSELKETNVSTETNNGENND